MGAITEVVRRYIPASYRAMIGPSDTEYYSLSDLQTLANYVQFKLMGSAVGATLEATSYDLRQVEFLGKVTTMKFIPAAIDYWMDQYEQEHLNQGETSAYPSRIAHLREVYKDLAADIANEADEVIPVSRLSTIPDVSYGDGGRDILITPDPAKFPQVIRRRELGSGTIPSIDFDLPWEVW